MRDRALAPRSTLGLLNVAARCLYLLRARHGSPRSLVRWLGLCAAIRRCGIARLGWRRLNRRSLRLGRTAEDALAQERARDARADTRGRQASPSQAREPRCVDRRAAGTLLRENREHRDHDRVVLEAA